QFDFLAASEKNGRKADGCTGSRSDAGASSPSAFIDDGSKRAAASSENRDARSVLAVGRSFFDGVLIADNFLIAISGIAGSQLGRELVDRSGGQRDRLQANRQLGSAFDASTALGIGHDSLDVAADRQDDVPGDADGAAGSQVDVIAVFSCTRGDGVFHAQ